MGKKGAKRKTRWRSFSIGAPPGEEDEEDEVRVRYQGENGNGTNGAERNTHGGYSSYKRNRHYNNSSEKGGYGYGSLYNDRTKSSPSKNGEESTKPKIVFNEEEYMRITTPRQDVLFKKGYLSRKKPLASTASTSATSATTTPSTNESQSAAHSTADGSETAEDQQLLDGSNGDYAVVPDGAAQFGYGGFYDQVTGYYYEYPVMLVGPPVPGHTSPTMLAAMPCGPVPLRPVEWFNPQYMPEEQHPPPHSTDSQAGSSGSSVSMEEVNGSSVPTNAELAPEKENGEVQLTEEAATPVVDEDIPENMQPIPMMPALVPHMHMPPQHYVYPGHFMFGPPMVNMNGVTIQNGAGIPSEPLWAKRRKKKKRRNQRRPLATGNTEDEEEEYSSDWETGSNWSQVAWSEGVLPVPTTTSRPLNPEVQEFQLRTTVLSNSAQPPTLVEESTDLVSPVCSTEVEKSIHTEAANESINASVNNEAEPSSRANAKDISNETASIDNSSANTNDIDIRNETISDARVKRKDESENEVPTEIVKDINLVTNSNEIIPKNVKIDANGEQELSNGHAISNENEKIEAKCDASNGIKLESNGDVRNSEIKDKLSDDNHFEEITEGETTKSEELLANEQPVTNNCTDISNEHASSDDNKDASSPERVAFDASEKANGTCVDFTVDNESQNKKGSTKNVKKNKGKVMEARKPPRNKREARNSRRSNVDPNETPGDSPRDEEATSSSSGTRQPLDAQSADSEPLPTKPSSRPVSPEINQTTTPINAETHRLPESYESLITRSPQSSATPPPTTPDAPIAPPRRKYSAKGLKFVREPTPGPDLDTDVKSDTEEIAKVEDTPVSASEATTSGQEISTSETPIGIVDDVSAKISIESSPTTNVSEDSEPVVVVADSVTEQDSRADTRVPVNVSRTEETQVEPGSLWDADPRNESNRFTGPAEDLDEIVINSIVVEDVAGRGLRDEETVNSEANSAAKLSDRPITNAVAAWVRRANSPEMFKVPIPGLDPDLSESETDENDEDREPPKNLQSNPMLALSVSNKRCDVKRRTRSSIVTSGKITKTDASTRILTDKKQDKEVGDSLKNISLRSRDGSSMIDVLRSVRLCDFTKGSPAGMRVAENSRIDLSKTRQEKRNGKYLQNNSVEDIKFDVRKITRANDHSTENAIEAIENVKTYERGEIVVSLAGKLLTGIVGESTCLENSDLQEQDISIDGCQMSSRDSMVRDEESISKEQTESIIIGESSNYDTTLGSRVNSFGSIDELDVMECWETEIIEPVITSTNNRQMMQLQANGKVHEGEATEEENFDANDAREDTRYKEHVQKYYRLAREYTTSIEENLSEEAVKKMNISNAQSNSKTNSPRRSVPNSPERMIECLCSEEIPVIVPLVESTFKKNDKNYRGSKKSEVVDEAFEVYESCYTGNTRSPLVPALNAEESKVPYRNTEGPIPCKAVCCNIQ